MPKPIQSQHNIKPLIQTLYAWKRPRSDERLSASSVAGYCTYIRHRHVLRKWKNRKEQVSLVKLAVIHSESPVFRDFFSYVRDESWRYTHFVNQSISGPSFQAGGQGHCSIKLPF
ncbi:hypothetical protein PV10_08925 [Exophiala mesophila]|uniref:Uncharacterized protein n=1 Tax=Exophiala mesophila TaxID=212818 RepID=A0A0D1WK80_EXOME|nr:uncharacterized protein PV10_08925 [Exophiala mesophila]KIV89350.1 hypothetical protein PV10_08925 [Exophiala mesophila]